MTESTVTTPLNDYLELLNFKKEIEAGKINVIERYEYIAMNYFHGSTNCAFYTKDEIIIGLTERNNMLTEELNKKNDFIKKITAPVISDVVSGISLEEQLKKMTIFELILWRNQKKF